MDIALLVDTNGESDISITKGVPAVDNGLETAVYISLFTDARDENSEDTTDKRGWWGDEFDDVKMGSKLWTLARAKDTDETIKKMKTYASDALQWMIADGIAKSVTVNAIRYSAGVIFMTIDITKPDGINTSFKYYYNWVEQAANPVNAR